MPQYQFALTKQDLKFLNSYYISKRRRQEELWNAAGGRREWPAYAERHNFCIFMCRNPRIGAVIPGSTSAQRHQVDDHDCCHLHLKVFTWARRMYERNIASGLCVICFNPAIEDIHKRRDLDLPTRLNKRGQVKYYTNPESGLPPLMRDEAISYKVFCENPECQKEYWYGFVEPYLKYLYFKHTTNPALAGLPPKPLWDFTNDPKWLSQLSYLNSLGVPGYFIHYDPHKRRRTDWRRRCIVRPCKGKPEGLNPGCKKHEARIFHPYPNWNRCLLSICKNRITDYPLCFLHAYLNDSREPWPQEVLDSVAAREKRLAQHRHLINAAYFAPQNANSQNV